VTTNLPTTMLCAPDMKPSALSSLQDPSLLPDAMFRAMPVRERSRALRWADATGASVTSTDDQGV